MSDVIIPYRFKVLGNTAAFLASENGIARDRELVIETDTGRMKLGDGSTNYNSLLYINPGKIDLAGLADGYVMKWNAAGSKWVVAAESGGGGGGALTHIATSTVSGSAVTSLTFSSLDLSADYRYIIYYKWKNPTVSAGDLLLFYNGDTTATNYYSQRRLGNGSTSSAQRFNAPYFATSGGSDRAVGEIHIFATVDGYAQAQATCTRGPAATMVSDRFDTMKTATVNPTSITISCDIASGIGIGSSFALFKVVG